ncbi:MAG TPA: aldo/keto reductase [Burkholderiaceae bacterium]
MQTPRIQISPNGPEFSRIALGLWRLGGWDMSPAQRLEFLEQALELGITTIDNADIYGSEAPFGEALALAPSLRDKLEIVTKCGIVPLRDAQSATHAPHYNTSRAHIIAQTEQSLRLMGIETIDVLLIHRPDPLMDADEVAEAFASLKAAGKVKHFGVSNFSPAQFELLASRTPLVTNQVELSPMFLAPLHDGTLDQCQQLRVAPMIWSALAGGRLFSDATPQGERLRATLDGLAKVYGVSATTIAYAWSLQHPSRPVVLTGSRRIDAAREAVAATSLTLARDHWFAVWSASNGFNVP